jgi:hypothetical protein
MRRIMIYPIANRQLPRIFKHVEQGDAHRLVGRSIWAALRAQRNRRARGGLELRNTRTIPTLSSEPVLERWLYKLMAPLLLLETVKRSFGSGDLRRPHAVSGEGSPAGVRSRNSQGSSGFGAALREGEQSSNAKVHDAPLKFSNKP